MTMTAYQIMLDAHRGQKHGDQPYSIHPEAVESLLWELPGFDRLTIHEQVWCCDAALLHDVLEDSDWTATDLRDQGIHPTVVEMVILLTRRDDVSDEDYYGMIKRSHMAVMVKTADMCHNLSTIAHLSPARKVKLTAKYAKGMAALHG